MEAKQNQVYKKSRTRIQLRRRLNLTDNQLSDWLLINGLTDDRQGCLQGIWKYFPGMIGRDVK